MNNEQIDPALPILPQFEGVLKPPSKPKKQQLTHEQRIELQKSKNKALDELVRKLIQPVLLLNPHLAEIYKYAEANNLTFSISIDPTEQGCITTEHHAHFLFYNKAHKEHVIGGHWKI